MQGYITFSSAELSSPFLFNGESFLKICFARLDIIIIIYNYYFPIKYYYKLRVQK